MNDSGTHRAWNHTSDAYPWHRDLNVILYEVRRITSWSWTQMRQRVIQYQSSVATEYDLQMDAVIRLCARVGVCIACTTEQSPSVWKGTLEDTRSRELWIATRLSDGYDLKSCQKYAQRQWRRAAAIILATGFAENQLSLAAFASATGVGRSSFYYSHGKWMYRPRVLATALGNARPLRLIASRCEELPKLRTPDKDVWTSLRCSRNYMAHLALIDSAYPAIADLAPLYPDLDTVTAALREWKTIPQTAKHLHVQPSWLRDFTLRHHLRVKGTAYHRPPQNFALERANDIRERRSQGESLRSIAGHYHISAERVRQIAATDNISTRNPRSSRGAEIAAHVKSMEINQTSVSAFAKDVGDCLGMPATTVLNHITAGIRARITSNSNKANSRKFAMRHAIARRATAALAFRQHTRAWLARELGRTPGHVGSLLDGSSAIELHTDQIAYSLQIPLEWLLHGMGPHAIAEDSGVALEPESACTNSPAAATAELTIAPATVNQNLPEALHDAHP